MTKFELNAEQQAMLTIIESVRSRAQNTVKQAAFSRVNCAINEAVEIDYAAGNISIEEYKTRWRAPTAEEILEATSKIQVGLDELRDYHTVGFHLPQRTGATSFAQWLLMDFMEKYPEARCLYIGTEEPSLFDVLYSKCDAIVCTGDNYDGICKTILDNTDSRDCLRSPTGRKALRPYSLVVFDSCNYMRNRDVRFEQLLRVMYSPTVQPVQMLVHFSS